MPKQFRDAVCRVHQKVQQRCLQRGSSRCRRTGYSHGERADLPGSRGATRRKCGSAALTTSSLARGPRSATVRRETGSHRARHRSRHAWLLQLPQVGGTQASPRIVPRALRDVRASPRSSGRSGASLGIASLRVQSRTRSRPANDCRGLRPGGPSMNPGIGRAGGGDSTARPRSCPAVLAAGAVYPSTDARRSRIA